MLTGQGCWIVGMLSLAPSARLTHVFFPLYGFRYSLQRTNTENSIQMFPEKELRAVRGQGPNFHTHVPVSDLYISTIDLPILLQEIYGPILGVYKWLTDT